MAKRKPNRSIPCMQGIGNHQFIHGMSKSPEHAAWRRMLGRCYRVTCDRYRYYGGRGIRVCKAWRESFMAFYQDIGPRPAKGYSIGRQDNDGHYSCGHCKDCLANGWTENCRWETQHEQTRNYSRNVMVTFRGETLPLKDWAAKLRISYSAVYQRIRLSGWSIERALTTPVAS